MFGSLLGCYTIYAFGGGGFLPPNGLLPGAKFSLRQNLAFSYIGSVIVRHSSSGRQPNFAALSSRRHLYSAGRPSRWASAHILIETWAEFQHSVVEDAINQWQTRMWANAQRDGRPAEYRWCPLFNAAKFG